MNIKDPIETTVEEIRKVLNIENVVGEVIETEDKVMIPVTRFGMAFGAGMGEGTGRSGQGGGTGAGSGGAAGIEPVAMVVVFKGISGPEGVKILSLKGGDPIARAISEVGTSVVEIMREGRKMRKPKKTEEAEEPEAEKKE